MNLKKGLWLVVMALLCISCQKNTKSVRGDYHGIPVTIEKSLDPAAYHYCIYLWATGMDTTMANIPYLVNFHLVADDQNYDRQFSPEEIKLNGQPLTLFRDIDTGDNNPLVVYANNDSLQKISRSVWQ